MAISPNPNRTARNVLEKRLFGEIHLRTTGERNRDSQRGDDRGAQSD